MMSIIKVLTVYLTKGMTPGILQKSYEVLGTRNLKLMGDEEFNSESRVAFWELPRYYSVLEKAAELGISFIGVWNLEKDPRRHELKRYCWNYIAPAHLQVLHQQIPTLKIKVINASDEMFELIECLPDNVISV